jgi:glycosyltransferase involved in cell wall biosynthesis
MEIGVSEPATKPKRVFFLIGECSGFRHLVREEVAVPEGAPSMYLPWLGYKRRGYEVDVFYVGRFKHERCVPFEGCVIHTVPRSWLGRLLGKMPEKNLQMYLRRAFENMSLYQSAARAAQTCPPSVVYALRPPYVHAARRLATRYGACFINRVFGTLLYPELAGHPRERTFAEHLTEKKAWLCPADMTIITNDGTNGDKVAELLGLPREQYRVWFNGIDKTWTGTSQACAAYRSKIGLSAGDFVLLCLSRLAWWKRQDRVIRAMELIVKEAPNARLVLAGEGGARPSLEKMVADLHLTGCVRFLGAVPYNDVQTIMGMANVFLQMNDYSNLGSTLLEAMVCGRTIVTWDVGGTSQVIADNETGRLLPDPEPETIAQAVLELIEDREKARRLGQNARRFVEEKLPTWDERVNMEIDLVEDLCARRAVARAGTAAVVPPA